MSHVSLIPELNREASEPLIFADTDVFGTGQTQRLHGFDVDPIADVGDLCDSDCIDCD